jgi:hypothetical protein
MHEDLDPVHRRGLPRGNDLNHCADSSMVSSRSEIHASDV